MWSPRRRIPVSERLHYHSNSMSYDGITRSARARRRGGRRQRDDWSPPRVRRGRSAELGRQEPRRFAALNCDQLGVVHEAAAAAAPAGSFRVGGSNGAAAESAPPADAHLEPRVLGESRGVPNDEPQFCTPTTIGDRHLETRAAGRRRAASPAAAQALVARLHVRVACAARALRTTAEQETEEARARVLELG